MAYQVLCKKEPWTKAATDSANTNNNKSLGKSSSLNAHQVMSLVLKGKRPEDLSPVPLNCPAALLELMRDCVAHEYFMRPSASEVVETLCAFLEAEAERTAPRAATSTDARTSSESDMQTLILKMAAQLERSMKRNDSKLKSEMQAVISARPTTHPESSALSLSLSLRLFRSSTNEPRRRIQ